MLEMRVRFFFGVLLFCVFWVHSNVEKATRDIKKVFGLETIENDSVVSLISKIAMKVVAFKEVK